MTANSINAEPIKSILKSKITHSKEWYAYIDEYLDILIQIILSWDTNIGNTLFSLHKYVTYFAKKSKAVLSLNDYSPGTEIKMASGKMYICTEMGNQLWKHVEYYNNDYYYQFTATFKTDQRLSLNITFQELYFSRVNMDFKAANISVFESGSEKEAQLSIAYDGYHAAFSLYPTKGSCMLQTSVHLNILLVLNATFSVVDSNLVKTLHVTNSSEIYLFSFWYIYKDHVEISSFIQIIKSHKITLKLFQNYLNQHLVHDGPGSMSDTLDPQFFLGHEMYIYSCSSFQSLVKIISSNIEAISVNYSAIRLNTALKKTIYKFNKLTLLGYQCNTSPCLIIFNAQNGFQVNATVLNMSYKSTILHQDCRIGGLSVIADLNGNQHENGHFCRIHNSSTNVSRSYYSSNSTLMMIFYTYENYSEINVTLEISLTKCKPVMLSLYDVEQYCTIRESNSHCSNYFEQITQGTSLSLSLPFLKQEYFQIVFSMSEPKCLVLQISNKVVHNHKSLNGGSGEYGNNRAFELASESIMNFGFKFHYQITGILLQDISHRFYPPDALNFISIDDTEKFCFKQFNKGNGSFVCRKPGNTSTCEKSYEHLFGCEAVEHIIEATQSDNVPIIVSADTKSPVTLQKFSMEFRFNKKL